MNEKFGKEYHRLWELKHRIERRKYKNNWDRTHARTNLNNKLRQLKQNCFFCGSNKTECHHPDYSRPNLNIWLCHSCHMKIHAIFRWITPKIKLVKK